MKTTFYPYQLILSGKFRNNVKNLFQLLPKYLGTAIVMCLYLMLSTSDLNAQTSPANCTQGCTSKDVKIITAYLSYSNGDRLPANFVCPQSGTAAVYLTLELTTKTPRQGVSIYVSVKNFSPPSTIGSPIAAIGQCFGATLNQTSNKVTFTSPFNWVCGTPIVLTDVFISWGTGNSNFCTGTNFQCGETPSKCYSLPPGEYIAVETPVANAASATLCSIDPDGTTAVFNLSSLDNTVKGTATNVTVTWFKDSGLAELISTPTNYTSVTDKVYAKVTSNSDSNNYAVSQVSLTVVSKPSVLVLTGSAICGAAPNTGTVSSSISQTGMSYQLFNAANSPVQPSKTGDGSGLNWSNLAAANGYYVIGTVTTPISCTSTSNVVNVTSTPNPIAVILTGSSICDSNPNTGTVSSTASASGVSYQLYNGNNPIQNPQTSDTGAGLTWTDLAVGSYNVIGTGASPTSCSSTSNSVNVLSVNDPLALSLTGSDICDSAPNTGTISSSSSQAAVSYQLFNGITPIQNPKTSDNGAGLTWTDLAAGSGYYVVGTGAGPTHCTSISNSVNIGSLTNPVAPSGSIVPISCTDLSFMVKVNNPVVGYKYKITQAPNNSLSFTDITAIANTDVIFTGLKFGDGYVLTVEAGGCTSTSDTCPIPQNLASAKSSDLKLSLSSETSVKAYPNPFSDKVNFKVNVPETTEGSLELINMLGQRVKTVYYGEMKAGENIFEVNIPSKQTTTLIYVLRTGDKKITGKLIQNKQ
ncbi:Por secretion system C-terminal sorting domain-containing protein [Flavobacteriaceae bacterium MAR_2010_188]|nr:Por secretion system C-terminal sorting domain-containing protein [Flavobacteriaceae bacterium MAR_2010_188]